MKTFVGILIVSAMIIFLIAGIINTKKTNKKIIEDAKKKELK